MNKKRPSNMVKKEERKRRMTNKGQIVLRELYQPKKYIECILKWDQHFSIYFKFDRILISK